MSVLVILLLDDRNRSDPIALCAVAGVPGSCEVEEEVFHSAAED